MKLKDLPKIERPREKPEIKDNYFPKYYLVDNEIYVEVKERGEDRVVGVNDLGNPYNPFRAILNGARITKEEFDKGAAERRREFLAVGLKINKE